jgi:hypothetical protein
VNVTYLGLIWEIKPAQESSAAAKRNFRLRSLITLTLFGCAAVLALWWPIEALAICIACLAAYLKPGTAN